MKKNWGIIALAACSVMALLASVYVYGLFTAPSIPTGTVVTGPTKPSVTQPTVSDENPDTIPHLEHREFAWTTEQENRIAALMKKYGGKVAFYYEDLSSGYTYSYNEDTAFFAASVIKAPYCLYLLQLASEGKCDLNEQVTYTADIKSAGTGIVKKSPYGTKFTVQQLIEYAIRHSDNAALRMLRSLYPPEGFRKYAETFDDLKNVNHISNITGANITAHDAGVYMRKIYQFIKSDETHGALLRKYMTTTYNPMFTSASYDIIRKYGWATAAFHDIAIVDAPYPYILVFLTDHAEGTTADFAMFRELSRTVEAFSGQAK